MYFCTTLTSSKLTADEAEPGSGRILSIWSWSIPLPDWQLAWLFTAGLRALPSPAFQWVLEKQRAVTDTHSSPHEANWELSNHRSCDPSVLESAWDKCYSMEASMDTFFFFSKSYSSFQQISSLDTPEYSEQKITMDCLLHFSCPNVKQSLEQQEAVSTLCKRICILSTGGY